MGADLGLRPRERGVATAPGAGVVGGAPPPDPADTDAVTNPTVIVEVLSPSTEAYDRGQKAAHYRRIPSVMEYVLVAQDAPRIEVFRRVQSGRWEFIEAGAGDSVTLTSIGCTVGVDEIFQGSLAESPQ